MSHDAACIYRRREEDLVGYLYGELDGDDRARFDAHLAMCETCRDELRALEAARTPLVAWVPPEPARALTFGAMQPASPRRWWAGLSDVPAWAQAAAAVLVLGVAAGAANLDIRHDAQGISVRTGWAPAPAPATEDPSQAWQTDLAALESRLREELNAVRTAASSGPATDPAPIRALIEESERRQRRELALRVADVMRDIEVQRRVDLERIEDNLGVMGARVLDLNEYMVKVSQGR